MKRGPSLNAKLVVGGLLTLGLLFCAGLSLIWTPWPVEEIDMAAKLQAPSAEHWFGTDSLGRDVASLLLAGTRVSLLVGVVAVAIGLSFGVVLGLWAAVPRQGMGWVDELLMRAVDLGFAFPALLIALLFTAVWGPGIAIAILAIGLHAVPTFARVSRAGAQLVWAQDFCLAARACGRGSWDISLQHVLPNVMPALIVQASLQFALAILAEAALSYLGLGTQAPEASWGRMLAEAQSYLFSAPMLAVYPGVAIMLAVLGLNLLGDGLRDLADPRRVRAMLEAGDLRIRIGRTEPVRGLSFTLAPGEVLGLVGESGSGKTLTALALMGLLPPGAQIEGRLRLAGQDLPAPGDDKAWCALRGRRIAMAFQEPMTALNPLHRVGRQVAEPLRVHQRMKADAAQAEARELLAALGLKDVERIAAAYPHELSGGQRQRAALAMALAAGPEFLIADEPTTALDTHLQGQALRLLGELAARRGMGLLLISHDLALVARHAQKLLVMYAGQGVEGGPAAALIGSAAAAAHPYTQGLLAARPRLGQGKGARLAAMPGLAPDPARPRESGCAFRPRCERAAAVCQQDPTPVRLGDAEARHWARCLRLAEEGASHG